MAILALGVNGAGKEKGPDRSGPEGLPFCTGGVTVRDINWKRPWVRPQSLSRNVPAPPDTPW